jgi:hypothetical protein
VQAAIASSVGVTALLGDATRPGSAPVAVVGFVVTVGSAVALSRHGEPSGQG